MFLELIDNINPWIFFNSITYVHLLHKRSWLTVSLFILPGFECRFYLVLARYFRLITSTWLNVFIMKLKETLASLIILLKYKELLCQFRLHSLVPHLSSLVVYVSLNCYRRLSPYYRGLCFNIPSGKYQLFLTRVLIDVLRYNWPQSF